jgi:TIR domain
VLAPICSPSYFESGWCTSEWEHFAQREQATGRQDLIIPLCHNNRGALPPFAQARQIIDFSDLIPSAATLYSPNAIEFSFHNRVGQFAAQVARAVCSAPAYTPWPVVTLPDPPPRRTPLHGLAA